MSLSGKAMYLFWKKSPSNRLRYTVLCLSEPGNWQPELNNYENTLNCTVVMKIEWQDVFFVMIFTFFLQQDNIQIKFKKRLT